MRDTPLHGWQSWRVKLAGGSANTHQVDRLNRTRLLTMTAARRTVEPIPAALKAEAPGPDGIRHGLVAHVRAALAAGTFETDARWQLAEDALFARLEAAR